MTLAVCVFFGIFVNDAKRQNPASYVLFYFQFNKQLENCEVGSIQ